MTVYLVGAGPGDPGLLTVRGAELLARADVVVYDRLSVARLLELAPAGAERIDVGKAPGEHRWTRTRSTPCSSSGAGPGRTVVRLKGGDPFVFGRGGEEAVALAAAGVAFEVVPGVTLGDRRARPTPASRSPIAACRPRSPWSPATRIHAVDRRDRLGGRWPRPGARSSSSWAWPAGPRSPRRLIAGGLDPDTPVAAVRWGTRPEQTTVRATLADAGRPRPRAARHHRDRRGGRPRPGLVRAPPAVRPAGGGDPGPRSRPSGSSTGCADARRRGRRGAGHRDRRPGRRRRRAAGAAGRWPRGDLRLGGGHLGQRAVERLVPLLRDARDLGGVRVAAVGPGTAAALGRPAAWSPTWCPTRVRGRGAGRRRSRAGAGPGRCSPAGGGGPRRRCPTGWPGQGLGRSTWSRPTAPCRPSRPTAAAGRGRGADVITFTSSSTVDQLRRPSPGAARCRPWWPASGRSPPTRPGPPGLHVDVVADEHTIDGLVAALVESAAPPAGVRPGVIGA